MANTEPHVLIAGGGPSGLIASILLNNIGISSTVVERANEPDEWCSKSYTLVLGDKGKLALERAGCLESASVVGTERKFVYFFDGKTGDTKTIPKQSSGFGFTRPLLVECLEKEALKCPKVRIKRGLGISSITRDDKGILATLEDGTVLSGFSHCVGADGKWSKVRQSTPTLNSQTEMITSKSWGVNLYSSKIPEGFVLDGTYVINPPKECMFYIIVSPLPTHGISISMVCYDDTLERYPWLSPPSDDKRVDGYHSWENEYSALPAGLHADNELAQNLERLFEETVPAFYYLLDRECFSTARINRRVAWLKMVQEDNPSYSTDDGRIALVGDSIHAMTPSMGEGANTAMESSVKLVDCIAERVKQKGESSCSIESLNEGFIKYGMTRPKECIPIVEASAARSILKK